MKNIILITLMITTGLLLGCDSKTIVSPDNNSDLLTAAAMKSAEASYLSNSNVYTFGGTLVGSSNLRRNSNGVSFNLKTTMLDPGSTYTIWMVVFNNPEECGAGGCGEADLGNAAVNGDVLYNAGSIAGGTGKATFAGNRNTGDNSGSLFGPDAPGIIDSQKAEIHFVVRTHGEKIPGSIREQIGTLMGGCDINACDDIQFAVHMPS